MAQSKINELEYPGRGGGGKDTTTTHNTDTEGNQLSSTPISGKGKPCLLLPQKKKISSLPIPS